MSASAILTQGLGVYGSASLVVTLGFGMGDAAVVEGDPSAAWGAATRGEVWGAECRGESWAAGCRVESWGAESRGESWVADRHESWAAEDR